MTQKSKLQPDELESSADESGSWQVATAASADRRWQKNFFNIFGDAWANDSYTEETHSSDPRCVFLLSTGENAQAIVDEIQTMIDDWGSNPIVVRAFALPVANGVDSVGDPMEEQIQAACAALQESNCRECTQTVNSSVPVWLILDLMEPPEGLMVSSASAQRVEGESLNGHPPLRHSHSPGLNNDQSGLQNEMHSIGKRSLNWLEYLGVVLLQHFRCNVVPHVLLLAQPSQRGEIVRCARQLSSLGQVPTYVAGPMNRGGYILKPGVWHRRVAAAVAGLLWTADDSWQYGEAVPAGSLRCSGAQPSDTRETSICALGGATWLAPTDLIQKWLTLRSVRAFVEERLLGRDCNRTVGQGHLVGSGAETAASLRDPSGNIDCVTPGENRHEVVKVGGALNHVSKRTNSEIEALPFLTTELNHHEAEIAGLIPKHQLLNLAALWRSGRDRSSSPARALLHKAREKHKSQHQKQRQIRRQWLGTQLSSWQSAVQDWTEPLLGIAGVRPNLGTYQEGLGEIRWRLQEAASLLQERLEEATHTLLATEETLKQEINNVDNAWQTMVETRTRIGQLRFIRPDYGWFWLKNRYFVLRRHLRRLSEAYSEYVDAASIEANLHVLRQLSLAQMQDVRLLVEQYQDMREWCPEFATHALDLQQEIEARFEPPWTRSRLEQLQHALVKDDSEQDLEQEIYMFLRHKPLPVWLQAPSEEILEELMQWLVSYATYHRGATALELLNLAFNNTCTNERAASSSVNSLNFSDSQLSEEKSDASIHSMTGADMEEWLNIFAATAAPLWPAQQLSGNGHVRHFLITPDLREHPPLTNRQSSSKQSQTGKILPLGCVRYPSALNSAAERQSLDQVRRWCDERENVAWHYGPIEGLLMIGCAPTDLEVLWL